MATWTVYGFEVATADTAGAYLISTSSAIAFANSTDWDNDRKIQVGYYSHYTHIVTDTSATAADVCSALSSWTHHMQQVSKCATAGTHYWVDTSDYTTLRTYATALSEGTPSKNMCVQFHFVHDVLVDVDPIQIWAGSAAGVTGILQGASVWLLEQGTASPAFSEATANNKLSLTVSPSATAHDWFIGMCANVLAVGLHNNGRVKISATYS